MNELLENGIIIAGVILVVAVITVFILKYRKRRLMPFSMDEMEGHDFEYYCADLLRSIGFIDVEVTKGSGDFGVDILAEREGISYAFQCKCYDKPIGVKAIQEVYAGRDFYGRMVGVVMTNQYFTQPAIDMAKKLNILLWDRDFVYDIEGRS